jgi:hypothetical protein
MKQQLTILGDRQSGRTRALCLIAIADAAAGEEVLYECETWNLAEETLRTAADLMYLLCPEKVEHIRRANGQYAIEFKGDDLPFHGGRIRFTSASRIESRMMRGARNISTHIMDNMRFCEPHPDALHVIRSVLR